MLTVNSLNYAKKDNDGQPVILLNVQEVRKLRTGVVRISLAGDDMVASLEDVLGPGRIPSSPRYCLSDNGLHLWKTPADIWRSTRTDSP